MSSIPQQIWHSFEWRFQRICHPHVFPCHALLSELSGLLETDSSNERRLALMSQIYEKLVAHFDEEEYAETMQYFKQYLNKLPDIALLDTFITTLMDKQIFTKEAEDLRVILQLLSYEKIQKLIEYKISQMKHLKEDEKECLKQGLKNLKETLSASILSIIPDENNSFVHEETTKRGSFLYETLKSFVGLFFSVNDTSLEDTPPVDRAEVFMRLAGFSIIAERFWALMSWFIDKLQMFSPNYWIPYFVLTLITVATWMQSPSLSDWIYKHTNLGYTNLTQETLKNPNRSFTGYETAVQKVVEGLIYRAKHPEAQVDLLVGITGAGKTEIIKEVAYRIAKGEYPELAGMEIYHVNTADLQVAGGNIGPRLITRLEMLTRDLKRKNNASRAIIFFDEVHALKGGITFFGDPSLQFLTAVTNIQCVAATTKQHYEDIILADDALKRRFNPLVVDSLDKKELKELIKKKIYSHDDINCPSDETVDKILELSDQLDVKIGQPGKVLAFLDNIIRSLRYPESEAENKRRQLQVQSAGLRAQNLSEGNFGCLIHTETRKKLCELDVELGKQREVVRKEQADRELLFSLRKKERSCRRRMVALAKHLQKHTRGSSAAKNLEKKYLLLEGYCINSLSKSVRNLEQNLIGVTLNVEKVKQVYALKK